MLLRKLIVFAVTSGLAKKAWDVHQQKEQARERRKMPVDITEVVARPVATADPSERRRGRKLGARRRSEGPAS
ncbi:hypothetical protein GCM10028796_08060 [Ramlibacter monticola]|jgi:hypothetical protein|uniref:Uncharacterized protein n=1 Tax=Ramlibacter monticola TaxID=1926872 RepID=A0A936YX01_9BURK|nr:hypothetical protein [Ramlibacter monticola]MBL0389666.1 hypothetical protein [Ramlibacter monticola]